MKFNARLNARLNSRLFSFLLSGVIVAFITFTTTSNVAANMGASIDANMEVSSIGLGGDHGYQDFPLLQKINKVIYGEDNRVEAILCSNKVYRQLALSTAAQIMNENLHNDEDKGTVTISAGTLQENMGVCKNERFFNQLTAANCSGFLVGADILVTAGHCVESVSDCANHSWVFDYRLPVAADYGLNTSESAGVAGGAGGAGKISSITVAKSSVYTCVEVIGRMMDSEFDYAVLRLDRKVGDRRPLAFRHTGKIADGTPVMVIGHPSGLPTKIADGAKVRDNSSEGFFVTNLDTYGGNSGSAVFNIASGEVEGILVRGATDYVTASGKDCRVSNRCSNEGCRGEDVTRITVANELKNIPAY
ncbi:MAG: trypsin-like peptidase domain-containing protein [Oligoflexia bacterium]|nr:trypsin-like peptidase domain-containing protein [Oligoflexia bacterium]